MPSVSLSSLEGGGTSSLPIASLVPFNSNESLIITPDGHHWLRTGHVTDDTTTYTLFTPFTQSPIVAQVIGEPIAKVQYGFPLYMRIK